MQVSFSRPRSRRTDRAFRSGCAFRWRSLFCLLGASVFFSGCPGPAENPSAKPRDPFIDIGIGAEPRDLDPHLVTGLPDFQVMLALFEGLVRSGPCDEVAVVPGVAEAWTVSENGRRYQFKLREDAAWSNGDPLVAEHFLFSIRRVLNPLLGSPHAKWLYPITGAEAFHSGEINFSDVGVTALSPYRLEIHLDRPVPFFLELLKHPAFYPVHPETIREAGAEKSATSGWTHPETFVGNGPYRLSDWKPGEAIKVQTNPHYTGFEPVRHDRLRFHPIDNANTEELGFRRGQLEITDDVPFNKRAAYRLSGDPAYREYPVLATTYLVFNISHPVLKDHRVRQALSLAVDRRSITEDIVLTGTPASGFVPEAIPGYDTRPYAGQRIETARRLLADAGYPGGDGFPVLEYHLSNSDTSREIAEAIQNMWDRQLGIRIRLVSSEFKVYLNRLNEGNFQIGYLAWFADFVDPFAFLNMMHSEGASNRSRWTHPRYDELLAESSNSSSVEARFALLKEAESILLDEAPIAPIYWMDAVRLVQPDLDGWEPRLMDLHPHQYLALPQNAP